MKFPERQKDELKKRLQDVAEWATIVAAAESMTMEPFSIDFSEGPDGLLFTTPLGEFEFTPL